MVGALYFAQDEYEDIILMLINDEYPLKLIYIYHHSAM